MKDSLIDPTTAVQVITSWVANPNPGPGKPAYYPVYTTIENSARVAEVVAQGSEFPIAPPLFWTPCADNVVPDQWYYNTQTAQIIVVPPPAPYPSN
jgi:hypothetical protein